MEASAPSRWRRVCQAVRQPVPAEHSHGFARSVAYANWVHATWLSGGIALLNGVFGLLPELHYYRSGFWPLDRAHLVLTYAHAFMLVFSLGTLALLLRWRPAVRGAGEAVHQRIAMIYGAVMLGAVTVFSIAEQRLIGSISAYLFGIAGFATLFYWPPGFSAIVLSGSLLGLVAGSVWHQPESPALWHHLLVAFDGSLLFWIASRIGYHQKAANYLQLVTIERQRRELEEANAQLSRANQFKTDLLSLAAHDLRDPLGTIALSAQSMREDLPTDSPLRPIVDGIDASARHLAEFVRKLLDDVGAEAQAITLERTPTYLPRLVEEITNHLTPLAEAKAIELRLKVTPAAEHAPLAMVDPSCFRQILENLVRNAVKYSPAQKRVWVDLAYRPDEGHRLSVRDEGPGFTTADQARLFQKFQRLSALPTRGENSTGLGLFIVKHLVTLHNGRVWAESPGPGRGATFVVVLA